ncbi:MAG: hypothetical protein K2X69_16505 [Silvanigrellaceae bacterium]|nr:hypothetical protein [Silvanigrellaceae bacterium]
MKTQLSSDIAESKGSEEELEFYKENEDFSENSKLIRVYGFKNKDKSVAIFTDKEKSTQIAIYPADYSSTPTKRNKYVMLNCYKYRLIWI